MKSVGITSECVCDLPEDYLREHDVDLIYYYITTDTGRFMDGCEITAGNVLEYMEAGGAKAETNSPGPAEYRAFFENNLKKYDEIVHISISGQVDRASQSAAEAREMMGDEGRRVTVVDSAHLSTGMGLMVMRAVELRDAGKSAGEIAGEIIAMRRKVSTTFIAAGVDHLYRNGRVSQNVGKLCAFFRVHPVLTLRDGRISLKMFRIGNYEKSVMRYIRSALKRSGQIDTGRLFITHAGCTLKMISQIRAEAKRLCKFDEIIVTQASATISGNCGLGTVGVIFVQK